MKAQKIYLKDYQKPDFEILSTDLTFDLQEDFCRVLQKSSYSKTNLAALELWLDGEEQELKRVSINGQEILPQNYELNERGLKLKNLPAQFELEIESLCKPQLNTALEGLYKSSGIFCTQCEAQGFRRITYFMDRPDVMTKYTVHIQAEKSKYPVLLSNGDRIGTKDLGSGRHQVSWQDPFKKPCYLFALVAGDLGVLKDKFVTHSGKSVSLEIYSPHGTQDRCGHAMDSLKKSMKWDEDRFGLEYDLSTYMILAVDDFNMGAMENKGLNIFNSKLVFAQPETATDSDYFNIESVIGHEYFHNWTGNRITCRDWFHLSLKEGLTVFRDQEFSMDMSSREMVRIENVADLRAGQFAEDAGPNSHPIRPESCYAVDNFYTSTIYEKGAEVIRMMQTLVGRPGFRKGMDLYFKRHDGQAVIIEDFAKAISDANDQDWTQFKLWYSQAGTPQVSVSESYHQSSKTYTLRLKQSYPQRPGEEPKKPFHIPLVFGLMSRSQAREIPTESQDGISQNSENQKIIHLKEEEQIFEFSGIQEKPILSINRQFSAPIHLDFDAPRADLEFLMAHDTDSFNRWESAQKILIEEFKEVLKDPGHTLSPSFLTALRKILSNQDLNEEFRSSFLHLPDDSYLSQLVDSFDGAQFLAARISLERQIAQGLETELLDIYKSLHGQNLQSRDPKDFGRRKLKNSALSLLAELPAHQDLVRKQFEQSKIMTDEICGFALMIDQTGAERDFAIAEFHKRWKNETLVLNKWFACMALSRNPETFQTVVAMSKHPDFQIKNPNRVYSLLRNFGDNLVRFHDPNQDTYRFLADKIIEIDQINPQVATRVAGGFDFWKKLNESQKQKAHHELERLLKSGLSKNTYEIVSKQLQ